MIYKEKKGNRMKNVACGGPHSNAADPSNKSGARCPRVDGAEICEGEDCGRGNPTSFFPRMAGRLLTASFFPLFFPLFFFHEMSLLKLNYRSLNILPSPTLLLNTSNLLPFSPFKLFYSIII